MSSKKKRIRTITAKAGELKMAWGKLPRENPEICIAWNDIVNGGQDSNLLFNVLASERYTHYNQTYNPSLIDELKSRGYDITTLKFSIQKLKPSESDSEPTEE